MGYAVLHLDKASGNEAKMTVHIERTQMPKNADPERTHLNRELIQPPDGVENRTEAIQHRLNNAGLTRKIGKNQVRAIRIMLTGSNEEMKRIEAEGRLDHWCDDNLDWLCKTYGTDNLVSAVLHMDEATPHIHATVVPIVTGERRKAKEQKKQEESHKKKYRKKNTEAPRLCADDVMTRVKLKEYQDSYAEAMKKYGLERGILGSEARHISTQEFYRNAIAQKQGLQENIKELHEQKEEVYETIRDLYDRKDEAKEKFLSMNQFVNQKQDELSTVEAKLELANRELSPDVLREDFNFLRFLFPRIDELLRIGKLCMRVGLSKEDTASLVNGKPVNFSGSLYSQEHQQEFQTENLTAKMEKDPDKKNCFRLTINGTHILEWFNRRHNELQRIERPHITPNLPTLRRGRGI